jgi:hypothetical protein
MNDPQRFAYRYPVTSLPDMINPRYARRYHIGKLHLGSILRLISGESSWHALISLLNRKFHPIPSSNVSDLDRDTICRQLDEMLAGVGIGDQTIYYVADTAFHLMRPTAPTELPDLSGPRIHAQNN